MQIFQLENNILKLGLVYKMQSFNGTLHQNAYSSYSFAVVLLACQQLIYTIICIQSFHCIFCVTSASVFVCGSQFLS